jgi:hypothetical protein
VISILRKLCAIINPMKPESVPPSKEPDSTKHGNAAKPISFHPLKVEAVVAALLKVKPEPKK